MEHPGYAGERNPVRNWSHVWPQMWVNWNDLYENKKVKTNPGNQTGGQENLSPGARTSGSQPCFVLATLVSSSLCQNPVLIQFYHGASLGEDNVVRTNQGIEHESGVVQGGSEFAR